MKKATYNKILNECSSYLNGNKSDLSYILSLEPYEMISDNNLYYSTPILNKIFRYSLLESLDLNYIAGLCDDSLKDYFDLAFLISDACCSYLADSVDKNSLHPTVLRYDSLTEGSAYYEIIMEHLQELFDSLTHKEIKHLFVGINRLNQRIVNIDNKLLYELVCELNHSKNFEEFCSKLTHNAELFAIRRLLLVNGQDRASFKYDCSLDASRIIHKSDYDNALELLNFAQKINEAKRDFKEINASNEIDQFNEHYHDYIGYQYSYIRNSYRENAILRYLDASK